MQITRCSIDMLRIVKGLYLVSQFIFYNCQEKWLQIEISRPTSKSNFGKKNPRSTAVQWIKESRKERRLVPNWYI